MFRKVFIIIHLRRFSVKQIQARKPPTDIDQTDLKGLLPEQLRDLATGLGEPAYRGDQLFGWIHEQGICRFEAMSNLPKGFRLALSAAGAFVGSLEPLERRDSHTGMAVKFLFGTGADAAGAGQIESVLIVDGNRRTACLSSQVGCALDCQFCATGRMGFLRNLGAGQIVDQLLQLHAVAAERGERVTNIVMMGMGEPLLNYDEVTRALRIIRHTEGPAVGGRRITVSTAGYLPGIQRLMADDLNVGLAISLNATTDEVRNRLMPINRKWPIAELLQAARGYFDRKGRRVTFEYVLLDGVNDSNEDAGRLARLTRDVPCKLNIIPYNQLEDIENTAEPTFRRPPRIRIEDFRRSLQAHTGHTVTLRESRGGDIAAACGQLYRSHPG
ncbi:MAG: 23S rRNA (adenine(2503)-C(2))-methyltransferase RlmN [Candidatus Latescibacteria bacterium]|jgi:23S rRNA (adenine2503-C2)-methyltransferase|nr:23S rRNA (adenine(2503)-C(2))-methyltransferase RlmN [Gemmatimonadaceae bacterium]MDP6017607.1 23S rRNA (adenine(2503)-C(2))-methyltransferase RlmN [Candidatus Latescibacterota bacterium]MDP7449581.1 23S rRNA (adenine(2503)-C(2))-methyltransferase RlmN [Candidatus Latescibacterota bacterium]HJP33867.1 23S rRNA (adenine(2503)-C(2))-methyltransferase RlmN [Candidatus Latescibacterota bacterium]